MSDWHTIIPGDASTLPTEADGFEEGTILWRLSTGSRVLRPWDWDGREVGVPAVAWMPIPPYMPPEPVKPRRRKHCGRVAFISDSGSQLVSDGSWAEVLPGDIDPDAAIRLSDVASVAADELDKFATLPVHAVLRDNLRAAVGECRR